LLVVSKGINGHIGTWRGKIIVRRGTISFFAFNIDKGLIPTKDDGPWHMLRRKGVP